MHELPIYRVERTHLEVLTDDIGIMQHAAGSTPDPDHGYCVDDVARALQVDLLHARRLGWAAIGPRAHLNLRFLIDAFDVTSGRFCNFRRVDGSWLDETASEDCQGRAMHALGDAVAAAPETAFVEAAMGLFERALPATRDISALRAVSSMALACQAAIRGGSRGAVELTFGLMADRLWSAFEPGVATEWPWPEPVVTYENGLPVRALIVAGQHHGEPLMVQAGVGALEWLVAALSAITGGRAMVIGPGSTSSPSRRPRSCSRPRPPSRLPAMTVGVWSWNRHMVGSWDRTTWVSPSPIPIEVAATTA